jgi:[ribosomal protein S5]-alanine N-acetyltransferase
MLTPVLMQTKRLLLRHIEATDAEFIQRLLSEPAFIRFIGDRGVRSLDDARQYIAAGPQASYRRHGYGLFLVEHLHNHAPLGICGLLKRDTLEDVDLGFAIACEYEGQGIAYEAAAACLEFARQSCSLTRVVAITLPENARSLRLLERLGFVLERRMTMPGATEEVLQLGRFLNDSR